MMEVREAGRGELLDWLASTPLFRRMAHRLAGTATPAAWAASLLDKLVADGLLSAEEQTLRLAKG
jgi:hypothetical protein